MDSWVNDESLFISRRLGSPEGVVQVFRCWSLDTPTGDHSFSLEGETANPSDLDPVTDWEQKDYLRLLEFLEVNSVMVNIRGHVLLKSEVKSRRAGRPDGPATYWRCFDLLPMQAFGLVRPVDTFCAPKFLIIGGEVNLTTPGKVIDVEGLKEGKAKYDKLDAEYKQLKQELDTLKETLGGVEVRERDMDVERQKAKQEAEELKIEVSNLHIQVSNSVTNSVLNDSLEKEKDLWALFVAYENLLTWITVWSSPNYASLNQLRTRPIYLSNYRRAGSVNHCGTWIVYRRDTEVTVTSHDPTKSFGIYWLKDKLNWEKENQTGRLVGYMSMNKQMFST